MNANLIFADLFCLSIQGAVANVEQEFGEKHRFAEAGTACNALC
jgi:hypothetical protein